MSTQKILFTIIIFMLISGCSGLISEIVTFRIRDSATEKNIENADVFLMQKREDSFVNITSQKTDSLGIVGFKMIKGGDYKLLIKADKYDTKEISIRPYETKYDIYLSPLTLKSSEPHDLFSKINYELTPHNGVIPPLTNENFSTCFSLNVISERGYIEFFSINSFFDNTIYVSNITNSSKGGVAHFCINLSEYDGYNITIDYYIKVVEEDLLHNQRQYFISKLEFG